MLIAQQFFIAELMFFTQWGGKGSLFLQNLSFTILWTFFCSWVVIMFALLVFSFLFKDRKSFTVETVSSTPTMSRSSSISGVDMAGLQTSFLSQVLYNCNLGFFDVLFFSSGSFINVENDSWELAYEMPMTIKHLWKTAGPQFYCRLIHKCIAAESTWPNSARRFE